MHPMNLDFRGLDEYEACLLSMEASLRLRCAELVAEHHSLVARSVSLSAKYHGPDAGALTCTATDMPELKEYADAHATHMIEKGVYKMRQDHYWAQMTMVHRARAALERSVVDAKSSRTETVEDGEM